MPAVLTGNGSFQTPRPFKHDDKTKFLTHAFCMLFFSLTPESFTTQQVKHRPLHLCFSYPGLLKIEYGLIGYEDYLYRISIVGDKLR